MESFLNGRQALAKVDASKGKADIPSQTLQQWFVPEPGSELQDNKNAAEKHSVAGGEHEPTVELVMVDGEVKKIQITCTCGQVIHLDCQYKGAGQVK